MDPPDPFWNDDDQGEAWVVAAELEKELGLKVIAASDGMKTSLEEV